MKQNWSSVKHIVENNQTFVLTTHINPDGDGLGCEVALAEYLRSIGKKATIINKSRVPDNYRFLDPYFEMFVFDSKRHLTLLEEADVFFILDISDWGRLREIGTYIKTSDKVKICIDHHHCHHPFTENDFIDSKVSSTGELVYELLVSLNANFNLTMATAIYTCILTDTGSFRFSNTTPRSHCIAAELIKIGVNSREIYQQVYEQNKPSKIKLLGQILQNLNFECNDKLVWFNVTQNMLDSTQANSWDTEGFADFPRTINGVEVSLMFTEIDKNRTKVSFRSKGRIPLNSVAMKLGGGGHEFASGALLEIPIQDANKVVIAETQKLFR